MKSKGNSSIIIIWVLIDTWWNVNQEAQRKDRYFFGFNRYMVECKLIFGNILDGMQFFVLIDTWWNVNQKANKLIEKGLTF